MIINATLNCLGTLLRTRQSIANKIISAIMNFNPLRQASSPMTPKTRVQIKSMERTTRALLMNILRRYFHANNFVILYIDDIDMVIETRTVPLQIE